MVENGGHDVVGIFRLAPDKDDCNWVKKQIDTGKFEGCDDVNIVSNLIKVGLVDQGGCLSLRGPGRSKWLPFFASSRWAW